MTEDDLVLIPIGVIHTPFQDIEGMPIQPEGATDTMGRVEVKLKYCGGLKDLEGFSHIILIYQFHRSRGFSLSVKPFLDDEDRGIFSTRAPRRPNPLGLSIVKLERVEGCTLHVRGIDVVDGTPLLDIKPYVPEFDAPSVEKVGWLEGRTKKLKETRSDDRFGK
jgi:tRNA-Thr(GGU) m(6)t(6)A37 methyltransferase TsaA